MTDGKTTDDDRTLILNIWSGDDGILFRKSDYEWVRSVNGAIKDATSWEDLRTKLPEGAERYVHIDDHVAEGDEYDPEIFDRDDPLVLELLTIASERLKLPAKITREFSAVMGSPASGSWRFYPLSRADELRDVLRAHGYDLIVRTSYEFPWWP